MNKWLKRVGLASIGVVSGALLTVGVTAYAFKGDGAFPAEDLNTFARVYGAIKRYYVEPVSDSKLVTDAISGMLSKLDPHSTYLDKTEFKQLQESVQGSFEGVGMQIDTEDGYIKVQSPIEGGPAERAGIKSGDLITKVGDKSTKNMTTTEAVKILRGEKGTKVTITVSRKGDPVPMVITLTRDTIKIASVRSKVLPNEVGYVRITQFQDRSTIDLVKELNKIGEKGTPKYLVLDLRNDPGGSLTTAIGVASAFLPANKVVVSVRGRQAEGNKQYFSNLSDYRYVDRKTGVEENPLKDLPAWAKTVPMVVLINQGSASASEIVAGALRDHERAKTLGIRSFGKGSVQSVIPLTEDTGIKLTIQRYYTPKDISIQGKGIMPDYNVDETAEGNPYAEFMAREADNDRALDVKHDDAPKVEKTAEEKNKEAEEKFKRLEKLRAEGRKPPEYGDIEKDYQLQQAMNLILGKPVATVKPEERKEDKEHKDEAK